MAGDEVRSVPDEFNFDSWIKANALSEVKHIFLEHDMRTVDRLSMQHERFLQFIASVSCENPAFVSLICNAFQKLSAQHPPPAKAKTAKLVVSEQEFGVRESLQRNIEAMDKAHACLSDMRSKLAAKALSASSLRDVDAEIETKFTEIAQQTQAHKDSIKQQLARFRQHPNGTGSGSPTHALDTLQQRETAVCRSLSQIETEQRLAQQQLASVSALLDGQDMPQEQRKAEILRIGKQLEERGLDWMALYRDVLQSDSGAVAQETHPLDGYVVGLNQQSLSKVTKHLAKLAKLKFKRIGKDGVVEAKEVNDTNADAKTDDADNASEVSSRSPVRRSTQCESTQLRDLKERAANLEALLGSKDGTITTLRAQLAAEQGSKSNQISALKQSLSKQAAELAAARTTEVALRTQVQGAQHQIEQLQLQKLTVSQWKPAQFEAQLAQKDSHIAQMEQRTRSWQGEVAQLRGALGVQIQASDAKDAELKRLRQELAAQRENKCDWAEIERWSNENARLRAQLAAANAEAKRVVANENAWIVRSEQNAATIVALQNKLKARSQAQKVEAKAKGKKGKNGRVQTQQERTASLEMDRMQRDMAEKDRDLNDCVTQISSLQQRVKTQDSLIKQLQLKGAVAVAVDDGNAKAKSASPPRQADKKRGKKEGAVEIKGNFKHKGNSCAHIEKVEKSAAILRQFQFKPFTGDDGKKYVDEFCALAKYGCPKVVSKHISSKKGKQKEWQCRIRVPEIGLDQVRTSKQKETAIRVCYQTLAMRISKNKVWAS